MAWECSDCSEREDDQDGVVIDAVCHHCGKPLCRKDQMVVALDDAFAPARLTDVVPPEGFGVAPAGFAVHCKSCLTAHHGRATLLEGLPK
ncbi:hypothetical protein [Amycolatopsis sp. NPDC021455]|uniref:hypothetical protein n=1 Tax=Amycolatopsis sp. NPDC021455 TaxID=3154901 RepID=UPI0033E77EA0